MTVLSTSSTAIETSFGIGTALTRTEVLPLGSIALSRESPVPVIKSRPLNLPLQYYLRMAEEHRLVQQRLKANANQHAKRPVSAP